MLPTLLFTEETSSMLSGRVCECTEINLIILRFKQSFNFSSEYLDKTKHILSFVLDKEVAIDFEVKRFKQFCKNHKVRIDYFYNDSEYNQEFIQKFARMLNLNGSLTENQALCVRDKGIMKDKIIELGLPSMTYQNIFSIKDINSFIKRKGFPIIVKWRRGLSSKEVYKINNLKDLENLSLDYSTGRYIVEEFSPHRIWCTDALIQNGKVVATFLTWLPYTNLSFAETKERFAQITVPCRPSQINFEEDKLAQKIVSGLNLENGYLHLETFIDELGLPTICEFAWRTPGEHMLLNHSRAYGIDIFSVLIKIITGQKISIIPKNGMRSVGDMFLPMPLSSGIIKEITAFSELSKFEGVIGGEVIYSIGDYIESKRQYTNNSGWVQIEGENANDVFKKMINVYDNFRIKI